MLFRKILPWVGGAVILMLIVGVPLLHGRSQYEQNRRLRIVTDGRVYRSGQLYGDGFRQAIQTYGIKTIVNLQEEDELVDPKIPRGYFRRDKERESEVCGELNVKFVMLNGGVVDHDGAGGRPKLTEAILEVFDNEDNYPILFHCKAGLHRTGWTTAIYRMEYEGWSRTHALDELRANGFGTFKSTSDNDYIQRYLFDFVPGLRKDGYTWPEHRAPRKTAKEAKQ
jgi:protein tyrosine/serine phosphatase